MSKSFQVIATGKRFEIFPRRARIAPAIRIRTGGFIPGSKFQFTARRGRTRVPASVREASPMGSGGPKAEPDQGAARLAGARFFFLVGRLPSGRGPPEFRKGFAKLGFAAGAPAPGVSKLTVVHDGFAAENETYRQVTGGWSWILAGLKSLLETGEPLPPRA